MRSGATEFAAWDGDTLVLCISGRPGASRNAIGKVQGNRLKVSVTAAPQAGRATEQMTRFLAKEFGVAVVDVEVVVGAATRNKVLRIRGPTALPAGVEWPARAGSKPHASHQARGTRLLRPASSKKAHWHQGAHSGHRDR